MSETRVGEEAIRDPGAGSRFMGRGVNIGMEKWQNNKAEAIFKALGGYSLNSVTGSEEGYRRQLSQLYLDVPRLENMNAQVVAGILALVHNNDIQIQALAAPAEDLTDEERRLYFVRRERTMAKIKALLADERNVQPIIDKFTQTDVQSRLRNDHKVMTGFKGLIVRYLFALSAHYAESDLPIGGEEDEDEYDDGEEDEEEEDDGEEEDGDE